MNTNGMAMRMLAMAKEPTLALTRNAKLTAARLIRLIVRQYRKNVSTSAFRPEHRRTVWSKMKSKFLAIRPVSAPLLTHHEVRDGRENEHGKDAVRKEVCEHFGQEVHRCAVVSARVLVTEDDRTEALLKVLS